MDGYTVEGEIQKMAYFRGIKTEKEMTTEKFKKFWVVSINNYLCDASYNGKELKEKHRFPSFRKFHFIKSWEDLNYFTKRSEITNEALVKQCLAP